MRETVPADDAKFHAERMRACAVDGTPWGDVIKDVRRDAVQWMIAHPEQVTFCLDFERSTLKVLGYRGALHSSRGVFFWDTARWHFYPPRDVHPYALVEDEPVYGHFGRPTAAERDWSREGDRHLVYTPEAFAKLYSPRPTSATELAALQSRKNHEIDGSDMDSTVFAVLRAAGCVPKV